MPTITTKPPTYHDVVFGRGGACNNFRANNAYYRALLDRHCAGYAAINPRDYIAKREFIRSHIINPIRFPPTGRFLTHQKGSWWEYSIDDPEDCKEVERTISQAFRDMKKRSSPSPIPDLTMMLQLTPSMPPAWQSITEVSTAAPTPTLSATATTTTTPTTTPTAVPSAPEIDTTIATMQQLAVGVVTSLLVTEATDLSVAANRNVLDLPSIRNKLDTVKRAVENVEREVHEFVKVTSGDTKKV